MDRVVIYGETEKQPNRLRVMDAGQQAMRLYTESRERKEGGVSEPKPCPFCGGVPHQSETLTYCGKCNFDYPSIYWNHRPTEDTARREQMEQDCAAVLESCPQEILDKPRPCDDCQERAAAIRARYEAQNKEGEQVRCEGYRLYPAFLVGGGTGKWEQCRNNAICNITIIQEGETATFPACKLCVEECETTSSIEVKKKEDIICNQD